MPKLFVPACGDRIVLSAPWGFSLWLERRSQRFAEALGLFKPVKNAFYDGYVDGDYRKGLRSVRAELPAGTMLEFDRVYVRQQNKSRLEEGDDYDSVTFKVVRDGKAVRFQRFWVKLADACEIEYELQSDSIYRERVKAVKAVMGS